MALVFLAASGVASAQYDVGVAAPNWTVPAYRTTGSSRGLSTMTDISPGVAFVVVSPCRVFDTRGAVGPYDGPRLVANATRNFDIDSGPCTGIPAGVDAYSMNFGAILPDGQNSFITIWPTGTAQPPVSAINPVQGVVVANAAIVPAGTNGSISVFPNTGVHLYADINGYFTDQFNPGVSFHAVSSNAAPAIHGENTSNGIGVYGTSVNGWGVHGVTVNDIGVFGYASSNSDQNFGVFGWTESSFDGSNGVRGLANNASGITYGVYGQTNSNNDRAAGVFGLGKGGFTVFPGYPAGVHGESRTETGVLGVTQGNAGVSGILTNSSGLIVAQGMLGLGTAVQNYSVYAFGDYGGSGAKYFVEPHPSDASKVIRYVSLEGPESGTYFRGRGKFQNGLATIDVPEDFRLVTDPEGLSVVATPIGPMATVSVASVGLDKIVLRASRNVEFFYIVNGVRKTHKHLSPIVPGNEYMPETADAKMPHYLTEGQKQMLISNGTYKSDGTVSMETARRLGWDREWEKRRPSPQPAE